LDFKCNICKVDTPCEHQTDEIRNAGWNGDQDRAEFYSKFLHDGDFEKWQPCCYMKHDSKEFQLMALAAQREYQRALWILNRFTIYNSPDWNRLCNKIHENWRTLAQMELRVNRDNYWLKNGEVNY